MGSMEPSNLDLSSHRPELLSDLRSESTDSPESSAHPPPPRLRPSRKSSGTTRLLRRTWKKHATGVLWDLGEVLEKDLRFRWLFVTGIGVLGVSALVFLPVFPSNGVDSSRGYFKANAATLIHGRYLRYNAANQAVKGRWEEAVHGYAAAWAVNRNDLRSLRGIIEAATQLPEESNAELTMAVVAACRLLQTTDNLEADRRLVSALSRRHNLIQRAYFGDARLLADSVGELRYQLGAKASHLQNVVDVVSFTFSAESPGLTLQDLTQLSLVFLEMGAFDRLEQLSRRPELNATESPILGVCLSLGRVASGNENGIQVDLGPLEKLALNPDDTQFADANRALILAGGQVGKLEVADAAFNRLQSTHKATALDQLNHARVRLASGDRLEAVEMLGKARPEPTSAAEAVVLVSMSGSLGRKAEVVRKAPAWMEQFDYGPELCFAVAEVLAVDGMGDALQSLGLHLNQFGNRKPTAAQFGAYFIGLGEHYKNNRTAAATMFDRCARTAHTEPWVKNKMSLQVGALGYQRESELLRDRS